MRILHDLVSVYAVTGHGFSLVHFFMYIFRGLGLLSENQFKRSTTYFDNLTLDGNNTIRIPKFGILLGVVNRKNHLD